MRVAQSAHLTGHEALPRQVAASATPDPATVIRYPDLAEVTGQPQAKRPLEIAATGRHSLLILCPSKPTGGFRGAPAYRGFWQAKRA